MTLANGIYKYRFKAMATVWEFQMWGKSQSYLESAAYEAATEIHQIESRISIFREESELHELNVRGHQFLVPMDPRTYALLVESKAIWELTGGAFDLTILPLLRAWGFVGSSGSVASQPQVDFAKQVTGMHHLILDDEHHAAGFDIEGPCVDPGAIGKGYAIDQVAEIMRDLEIPGALLHGGSSTICAINGQEDGTPWKVAITDPNNQTEQLGLIELCNSSLSVSAVHGKSFDFEGKSLGHILDPRTGYPCEGARLTAVLSQSAAITDALSTALLVGGSDLSVSIDHRFSDYGCLIATPNENGSDLYLNRFPLLLLTD